MVPAADEKHESVQRFPDVGYWTLVQWCSRIRQFGSETGRHVNRGPLYVLVELALERAEPGGVGLKIQEQTGVADAKSHMPERLVQQVESQNLDATVILLI